MYLTYETYTDMGGALEETAFNNIAFDAQVLIDWWTFNRLQKEETLPDAVIQCMYKLISLIDSRDKALVVDAKSSDGSTTAAGIASESNDGVSTSYNTLSAKDAVDTFQHELESTIKMYLQGVRNSLGHRLLYRGVYPNE